MTYTFTRQREIREAFWRTLGRKPSRYYGKTQNALPADIRTAFVNFVDLLAREGSITERLAARVTL